MSKIGKLTPEQEAKLPEYRRRVLELVNATGPSDRVRATAVVKRLYEMLDLTPAEKVIFARSPKSGTVVGNELVLDPNDEILAKWTPETNDEWVKSVLADAKESKEYQPFLDQRDNILPVGELMFYRFFGDQDMAEYTEKNKNVLDVLLEAYSVCGYVYLFDKCAIVCDRPSEIVKDADGKLLSFAFSDGFTATPEVIAEVNAEEAVAVVTHED